MFSGLKVTKSLLTVLFRETQGKYAEIRVVLGLCVKGVDFFFLSLNFCPLIFVIRISVRTEAFSGG